jgi:Zn-dependent protease with chaperone function
MGTASKPDGRLPATGLSPWLGLLISLALGGCSSTRPTAVDVDRKQNLAVPQVAADVVSKLSNFTDRTLYRAQGLLDTPSVQYQDERVQAMFRRLIAQVDVIHPEASTWDWEIHVVDRGRVNAYTVGAGKVMVYRGLIEHLALTEDELAFILAHEIAHNLREHMREYWSNYVPIYAAGVGLSQALSPWASAMIIDYGVDKNLSRTKEIEADRIGLELMARAGFNPKAAQTTFQKFYQEEQMSRDALGYLQLIPRWTYLRTHPLSEDRETDVRQQQNNINDIYELSGKVAPAEKPLSSKTTVNQDYIDDYEKLYLVGRIAPETVFTRLVHAEQDVSFGTDLGYGWMLHRTPQGGLNLHAGLTLFYGDPQIRGNFGGVFTELGWVFNPNWQVYGRWVSAEDIDGYDQRKQKLSAGVRWGNYNLGHLYLEMGQGRAQFIGSSVWTHQTQTEFGYAFNFGIF